MAGITLAQAQAKLDAWLAAETAIAERGQTYTINGRSLGRANHREVRESIDYWNEKVKMLTSSGTGRRGPRYAVGE